MDLKQCVFLACLAGNACHQLVPHEWCRSDVVPRLKNHQKNYQENLSATVLECHEEHESFCQVVVICCWGLRLSLGVYIPLEGKLSLIYKCKTKAYAYSISDIWLILLSRLLCRKLQVTDLVQNTSIIYKGEFPMFKGNLHLNRPCISPHAHGKRLGIKYRNDAYIKINKDWLTSPWTPLLKAKRGM